MSLKTFKLRYIDGKKNTNATYSINTQDVTQPKQTCWQSERRCTFLANGCVQMLSPSIPRCLVRQLLRAQTSIWQDNFPLIALFGGCCEAVYYPCCSKGAKPIIDAVSRTFLLLHHLTHMALVQLWTFTWCYRTTHRQLFLSDWWMEKSIKSHFMWHKTFWQTKTLFSIKLKWTVKCLLSFRNY